MLQARKAFFFAADQFCAMEKVVGAVVFHDTPYAWRCQLAVITVVLWYILSAFACCQNNYYLPQCCHAVSVSETHVFHAPVFRQGSPVCRSVRAWLLAVSACQCIKFYLPSAFLFHTFCVQLAPSPVHACRKRSVAKPCICARCFRIAVQQMRHPAVSALRQGPVLLTLRVRFQASLTVLIEEIETCLEISASASGSFFLSLS